jgi:PAS domain S-box-containing protein/diguanylate cyclase (GGDEF)-like protein
MAAEPENLSLAASLFAAVVPRRRVGARGGESQIAGPAHLHGATVTCLCDAQGVVLHITQNARHILGEACERAPELGLTLSTLLQPEDPSDGERATRELLRLDRESCALDLLTRAPSGGPRWLEIWSRNLLQEVTVSAFLLEIRDVTLRRVDDRLRELVRSAMQHLPESVMLTDTTGVIRYVNPAFERITGYAATEAIGQSPALLKSGQHRPEFYQKLWRMITSGQIWEGDLCNRRKSGELYFERVLITPVRDSQGIIIHFLSAARDVTESKQSAAQVEEDAYYDELTGLPVARLLRERAIPSLALARRHGHRAALLHIDVDGLRALQQSHGRNTADEVVRRLAERLRQGLRDSDTIARLDQTDTFVILLSEVTDEDAAARVVRRLRDQISQAFEIDAETIVLAGTIGVALCPEDGTSFDELATVAAHALQHARSNSQAAAFARPELTLRTNERIALEDDFRWAWERRQFVLHYQPVIALSRDTAAAPGHEGICGFEAVARWPHLERGLVEAAQFNPLAERTGHIVKLDQWAIENALGQAAAWTGLGWPGYMAINLSERALHDPDLLAFLASRIQQHEIDPARLLLEIAEGAALRAAERSPRLLEQLRSLGVKIALDDVGFGSTSVLGFWSLPIDQLKLHQSLIREVTYEPRIEGVVSAIMTLARGAGIHVVALGVEETAQLEWLHAAGCDYVQSDLTGRPVPADELEAPDFTHSGNADLTNQFSF